MGLGITGPIGADVLADLAITRTVRVTASANATTAGCKICGASLPKGRGQRAVIVDQNCYLCRACVKFVEAARKRVAARHGDDAART